MVSPFLPLHLGTALIKADGGFDSQAAVISDCGVPSGSGLQCPLGAASSTLKPLHRSCPLFPPVAQLRWTQGGPGETSASL